MFKEIETTMGNNQLLNIHFISDIFLSVWDICFYAFEVRWTSTVENIMIVLNRPGCIISISISDIF